MWEVSHNPYSIDCHSEGSTRGGQNIPFLEGVGLVPWWQQLDFNVNNTSCCFMTGRSTPILMSRFDFQEDGPPASFYNLYHCSNDEDSKV